MKRRWLILTGFVFITAMFLVSVPTNVSGWPADSIYVQQVSDAPIIDGQSSEGEWSTDEEVFRDTVTGLALPEDVTDIVGFELTALRDSENLYLKIKYSEGSPAEGVNNSIGVAISDENMEGGSISGMQASKDRKVAYWDADSGTMNNTDFWGCFYHPEGPEICSEADETYPNLRPNYFLQPGIPDIDNSTDNNNFDAMYGREDGVGFFEFRIPLNPDNTTEDVPIRDQQTWIKLVAHPANNIALNNTDLGGHGNRGSNQLLLQWEPRCFFCQPEGPIDSMSTLFNGFFSILISGLFLSFILARVSPTIANKMWKLEVDEDMAKRSVLLEMAYYNSSFISILLSAFFLMFSLIGLIYGWWANWDLTGVILYGIPTLLGIIAIVILGKDNYNPQEREGGKPGIDVQDSDTFWIVPTAFLAITLLMLVFIGIDVLT